MVRESGCLSCSPQCYGAVLNGGMMGFLSSFLPPQVGALDDAVKNITEKLAAKGLFDDTLLIFTTGK